MLLGGILDREKQIKNLREKARISEDYRTAGLNRKELSRNSEICGEKRVKEGYSGRSHRLKMGVNVWSKENTPLI